MTARKLIEEAKFLMADDLSSENMNIVNAMKKLNDALSLLPEWQEFDPERSETWPKKRGFYQTTIMLRVPAEIEIDFWSGRGWENYPVQRTVVAYQPLPSPYVKP